MKRKNKKNVREDKGANRNSHIVSTQNFWGDGRTTQTIQRDEGAFNAYAESGPYGGLSITMPAKSGVEASFSNTYSSVRFNPSQAKTLYRVLRKHFGSRAR